MTPREQLLLDYAAGRLAEPLSAAVAGHLTLDCDARREVASLEAIGGCLLEVLPPAELEFEAFERTFAKACAAERLAAVASEADARRGARPRGDPAGSFGGRLPWPVACYLDRVGAGPWQKAGPGLEIRRALESSSDVRALLVRAAANLDYPHHAHLGLEATLVLEGGYTDQGIAYGRGALHVSDEGSRHRPKIDPEGCLCFIALEGSLALVEEDERLLYPLLSGD